MTYVSPLRTAYFALFSLHRRAHVLYSSAAYRKSSWRTVRQAQSNAIILCKRHELAVRSETRAVAILTQTHTTYRCTVPISNTPRLQTPEAGLHLASARAEMRKQETVGQELASVRAGRQALANALVTCGGNDLIRADASARSPAAATRTYRLWSTLGKVVAAHSTPVVPWQHVVLTFSCRCEDVRTSC